MERVTDEPITGEVYENELLFYLQEYCELNRIEDIKKESQSVWNGALRHIYKRVFKGTDKLKYKGKHDIGSPIPTNCNSYDYDLLMQILDVYMFDMCMAYDKEISIVGFSTLTGVEAATINLWGNGNGKLGSSSFTIYEKLHQMREESLSNKLVTGKQNPVGVLGVLNRHYQWNLPGVSREKAHSSALGVSELPKLGQKAPDGVNLRQIAQQDFDDMDQ